MSEEQMSIDEAKVIINRYEKKLQELMPEKEYLSFCEDIARDILYDKAVRMADAEMGNFILDNFEALTGSDAEFMKLYRKMQGEDPDEE